MRNFLLAILLLALWSYSFGQKKPLDHTVYDSWQSIGEKTISNDGKYFIYTVNVQEGDGELIVGTSDSHYHRKIPRAYQASFTSDSRFLVMKIKPFFKDTRQAKIKKKAAADMPKDSLAILFLVKDSLEKIPDVKSYKITEQGESWLAYHVGQVKVTPAAPDSLTRLNSMLKMADSLSRMADSLRLKVSDAHNNGMKIFQSSTEDKKPAKKNDEKFEEGTELVLRNLSSGSVTRFNLASEYLFSKSGNVLVVETTRKTGDVSRKSEIIYHDLNQAKAKVILRGFQDARNFAVTENGEAVAFVADRDSSINAQRKLFKLWSYERGMDSAIQKFGPGSPSMPAGWVVNSDYANYFSKDGNRLFFGISPAPLVKDTSLVDFETAKLDVWNYRDDYLQSQQLVQLNSELKRSYLVFLDRKNQQVTRLGDESLENIDPSAEGNGRFAMGRSSKNYRIQQQWSLNGWVKLFVLDMQNGTKKQIGDKIKGSTADISPLGNFITWYNTAQKQWMVYDNKNAITLQLTKGVKTPLYEEDDDHPDDPPAYGILGWLENDKAVYVYDRYDIWKCDPAGNAAPVCITASKGRKNNVRIRFENLNREEKFLKEGQPLVLNLFDYNSKGYGWKVYKLGSDFQLDKKSAIAAANMGSPIRAKSANTVIYQKQTPSANNLYMAELDQLADISIARKISDLNPQQQQYNWFTVELHHWKMFDGKMSEGLLYKPENFDSTKKYPVIFYYYERNADNRYNYIEPMPVRASVNIAYYTSNGYIVFDPNIYYKKGQPGEDAYNSVVSAAKWLSRFSWVDSTKMGLQGHSWGGYQTAYLVTRTNMFAAAEAGAAVSNMTSAYGGIRWGTGLSRQFQYERSQSRIGATLWEKPELYVKNSPLFRVDKIKTPLLLLNNDKDDAVPWYQGIEMFTAMRRLGKPVWMINYNDELHGIMERKNRKDWTIRMAQFFDHYLKNTPAPKWMSEGIPAVKKGIDWGL